MLESRHENWHGVATELGCGVNDPALVRKIAIFRSLEMSNEVRGGLRAESIDHERADRAVVVVGRWPDERASRSLERSSPVLDRIELEKGARLTELPPNVRLVFERRDELRFVTVACRSKDAREDFRRQDRKSDVKGQRVALG